MKVTAGDTWLLPKTAVWSGLWAACDGPTVVATRRGRSGGLVRTLALEHGVGGLVPGGLGLVGAGELYCSFRPAR
jgi:hypothetical protein